MKTFSSLKSLSLLSIIISILCQGCSHLYYAPGQPYIPNLKKKGDYAARFGYGGGDNIKSVQLDVAYSPVSYLSASLNGTYYYSDKNNRNSGNGRYIEANTGLYIPVHKILQMGCNVGYGRGDMIHYYGNDQSSKFQFQKWHVTPYLNFGLRYVHFFAAARFGPIHYTNIKATITATEEALSDIAYIARQSSFDLVEPSLGIRAGTGYCYWQFQLTRVLAPEFRNNDRDLFTYNANFSFSINQEFFSFLRRRKQLRKKEFQPYH